MYVMLALTVNHLSRLFSAPPPFILASHTPPHSLTLSLPLLTLSAYLLTKKRQHFCTAGGLDWGGALFSPLSLLRIYIYTSIHTVLC
jgi:hypothetical protein